MDVNSLAHTKWEGCHIVVAPKYRRQVICRDIKAVWDKYRKDYAKE